MRAGSNRFSRGLLVLALALSAPCVAWAASDDGVGMTRGEPTRSELLVSEAEWARELVDVLGLESALPEPPQPADRFSLLCPARAELELAAGGRELPADGRFRVAVSAPSPERPGGPVRMVVSVPATSLYQLSVEGVGLQRWVIDGDAVGHLDPSSLGVSQATRIVALREGAHELAAYLTPGARVDRAELSAYRVLCVAPADGWRAERALRNGAMARTLVRAFGFERRLPEIDDEEQRIQGERFDEASAGGGRSERRLGEPASGRSWAAAETSPTEFTWSFQLEKPRVVTIRARTHGVESQLWSVDGTHRVTLVPEGVAAGFAWNHVMTLALPSGRHALRALVARGSGVDELAIVSHRSSDSDHVEVLRSLGFQLGASAAPVSRSDALELLRSASFIELASNFKLRMAGDRTDRPIALVDDEPDPYTTRSLSPLLPAEL